MLSSADQLTKPQSRASFPWDHILGHTPVGELLHGVLSSTAGARPSTLGRGAGPLRLEALLTPGLRTRHARHSARRGGRVGGSNPLVQGVERALMSSIVLI